MYDANGHEIVLNDSAIATSNDGRKFAGVIVAISGTHPKVLLCMDDLGLVKAFHSSRVAVQLNEQGDS